MSKRRRLSDYSFVLIGSSSECRNKDDVVQEDSDDFEPEDSDDSDPEDHSHDSDDDRKLTGCFISICAALPHLSFQVASSFQSALSHLSFCHISKRGNEIVMQSNKDGVAQEDSAEFEPEDDVVQEDNYDFEPEDSFETEYTDYSSEYSLPSSPSAEFPRCRNRKRKSNKYSSRGKENYVVQEDSDESNLEDSHNFDLNPTVDDYLFMFRPFKFRVDDYFLMFRFKVRECRNTSHDWRHNWMKCPYAHPGEKARRRDPRKYHYSDTACPDYQNGACRWGDACEYAHGEFECLLHPAR